MLPILRIGLIFAMALGCSLGAAAEETTHFDYAMDDTTEVTLQPFVDDAKTWQLDLRRYGTAEQGMFFRWMGNLKQVAPDVFLYEEYDKSDGSKQRVQMNGKPGTGGAIRVTSRGLTTETGLAGNVDGGFEPLAPAKRLERAKQHWEKADAVLNQVYAHVKAEVGKAGETKLRELQRGQIDQRDGHAVYDAIDNREHPKESPLYWDTMLDFTTSNIAFLKIYTGREVPKGLTGKYDDGEGGLLELEETPKGLKFSVSVVRGRTSHTGEIAGLARLKENRATFKVTLSKEEAAAGQKAAELTFTMSAGHIVHIDAKNAGDYGGAHAYFDGDYYKSGKLPKPIDLTKSE